MIDQIALGALGASAILLSQHPDESRRRFAPILGLMAQPFWLYTTYVHQQWSIFVLSFFYAYAWWTGFKQHWRK